MRPAGRHVGITAAFLTLAALVTASTGGSAVADRCKGGGWRHLAFRNQGECVSLAAHGGQIWNLADDFRVSPNQENPNPDFEGRPGVWHFLSSAGLERDPATYGLYPHYTVFDTNREGWDGGPVQPLPTVSILKGIRRVFMHPGDGTLTVVGWRSPVTGVVLVRGLFEHDASQTCGTGVGWAIDGSTDTATTSLASGVLATGASMGFALSTAVAEGDFLYFSVDPNGDFFCDTTFLDLTISGPLKGD